MHFLFFVFFNNFYCHNITYIVYTDISLAINRNFWYINYNTALCNTFSTFEKEIAQDNISGKIRTEKKKEEEKRKKD